MLCCRDDFLYYITNDYMEEGQKNKLADGILDTHREESSQANVILQ